MSHKRTVYFCIMMTCVLSVAATTLASTPFVYNDSGANARFGWSGGIHQVQNPGSMGSPTVDAAGFHFVNDYAADPLGVGVGGAWGRTTDTANISVTIDAADATGGPQAAFTEIIVREWGTFHCDSGNPAADFGGTPGQIFVEVLEYPFSFPFASELEFPNPTFTYETATEGVWSLEVVMAYDDPNLPWDNSIFGFGAPSGPWSEFYISVDNWMSITQTGQDNGSWMSKGGMEIIVPEPASALLLVALACPLLRRRGRRQN